MDNYLYPHFGVNIKRRALFRGITLVVLVVAAISILYGVWGPTLTPAVPDDLTAVRLSGGKGSRSWEYTVTDPEQVAAFARAISDIGPLPKARPAFETFFGHRIILITLVDSAGEELTYTLDVGVTLQAEDSPKFEYLYDRELQQLIWDTIPDDTPGWIPIRE